MYVCGFGRLALLCWFYSDTNMKTTQFEGDNLNKNHIRSKRGPFASREFHGVSGQDIC